MTTGRGLSLFLLCGALSACGGSCSWPGTATAGRVTATPSVACPGSTVRVDWQARESGAVDVRSPTGVLLGTAQSGSATFVATSGGQVSLTVDGASSSVSFEVVRAPRPFQVVVPTTCTTLPGGLGVAGSQDLGASFDTRLQLDWMRVVDRRYADVSHGGTVTSLLGGLTTPASGWAGGLYLAASLLEPDETCGVPGTYSRPAPSALVLQAQATCR